MLSNSLVYSSLIGQFTVSVSIFVARALRLSNPRQFHVRSSRADFFHTKLLKSLFELIAGHDNLRDGNGCGSKGLVDRCLTLFSFIWLLRQTAVRFTAQSYDLASKVIGPSRPKWSRGTSERHSQVCTFYFACALFFTIFISASAPTEGEDFQFIADDYQKCILPGIGESSWAI
jgi:hypothetical protein